MFYADKTRMIGLPYGEKIYDNMLRRFYRIPERQGQTYRHICYNQYRASVLRGKNKTDLRLYTVSQKKPGRYG